MSPTIRNGANYPINFGTGTVPDVSGATKDYFQPMVFAPVQKTISGFQVVEEANWINFRGIIMPYTGRQLKLLPEGQRAWTWYSIYAETELILQVDDVVQWTNNLNGNQLSEQLRIMGRMNYQLYGFVEYTAITDWQGAGPSL